MQRTQVIIGLLDDNRRVDPILETEQDMSSLPILILRPVGVKLLKKYSLAFKTARPPISLGSSNVESLIIGVCPFYNEIWDRE